jgi:GNAT superfamily N-acetyltransferase
MTLLIRPVQAQDHTAWLPLWHGYLGFYLSTVGDAQTALTWQRMLDPAHPLQGWVAEREEQLIGFAHIFMHGSTWSDRGYCYLEDLFVSEAARGQGVARQLIENCATWANSQGADKLYWLTRETNHTACSAHWFYSLREGLLTPSLTL